MNCTHDSKKTEGAIGMYHCPECGNLVMAGLSHLDYDILDNLNEEDIKIIGGQK